MTDPFNEADRLPDHLVAARPSLRDMWQADAVTGRRPSPPRPGMQAVTIRPPPTGWSPAEIATTIAWSLQSHADELRRRGRPVPHWLPAMAGVFTAWATGGATSSLDLTPRPEPRLLTYAEVGHLLAVSPRTVQRLVEDGDLVAVKVRGLARVRAEDVDNYLNRLIAVPKDDRSCQDTTIPAAAVQTGHGEVHDDHAA